MKMLSMAVATAALLALGGCEAPAFHQNWPGGSDYQPHAGWQRDRDADRDHAGYDRREGQRGERACRDRDDCWR
jgi:hypothetical protein